MNKTNHDKSEKKGRLPDFMLIGSAKSGTSTLYEYLYKHPEIFMSEIKEPEFFSRQEVYDRGILWYKSLFAEAGENQVCGEASTTYTRWPHTLDAPEKIAQAVRDPKFIYIMRHPVDRAYSHYGHHMRLGVTMTFEQALERDDIYADCSMYMKQIERFLRFFPAECFLFLFYDELRQTPRNLLEKIYRFLNVQQGDFISDGIVRRNIGGAETFIRSKTTMRLKKIPLLSSIIDCMPRKTKDAVFEILKNSFIGRRVKSQYKLQPMLPETRKKLLDLFEEPNRKLEKFLGVSLDRWRV